MKKTLYSILTILMFAITANAQKIGHISAEDLLQTLPEYEQANIEMENFATELKKEFETFATMYQTKEANFMKKQKDCETNPDACDQALLEMEYKNVMESGKKLEEMQYEMQTKVQERQEYLLNKIVVKIKAAAAEVAKEKGLDYVLDSSTLIYAGGVNLNDAVKAKLLAE